MQLLLIKELKDVFIINNFYEKMKYLNKDVKLYKNKKRFNTFWSSKHDFLILNEKFAITHIYRGLPKYKIITLLEEEKNTSLLVLPQNASVGFKIGDVLPFKCKHVI